MQKTKDGYRASFRLNEDNSEHMEIYQMFQELMNAGKSRNESDLYRAAIASLYREKQGNSISDEHKAELQEYARMSANEVREMVQEIINTAIADLKTSAIRVVPTDSDISSKSMENMGMKPPESSEVLPDDIFDFMKTLV
ncbi:MAG: hypothetical protein ACK5ML_04840 [Lachnospiraceae bacterium]